MLWLLVKLQKFTKQNSFVCADKKIRKITSRI
jgi:hypothetical protein